MSYILDALKKSEKERTLGNIPTLESGPQTEGRRVPLSWFIAVLALIAALSVLFGAWSLWRDGTQTVVVPDSGTGDVIVSSVPRVTASVEPEAVEPDVVPVAIAVPEVTEPTEIDQTDIVPPPVPLSALDSSVRGRLPDLAVNVLSYSENIPRRFVMINQNIYKEGQDIGGGIVIEEITKSHVILSFEEVRFTLLP